MSRSGMRNITNRVLAKEMAQTGALAARERRKGA